MALRQRARNRNRIAEISVPAWPIPTQNTKLMMPKPHATGRLLPQVPMEHEWDRETFLSETCRKAWLPLDAWKHGAHIEAFTAEIFGE